MSCKAIALVGLLLARPVLAEVEVRVDKFSGMTTITTVTDMKLVGGFRRLCDRPLQRWTAVVPEAGSSAGLTIGVTTIAACPDWKFLRCHDLRALVDGERLAFPDGDHDGESNGVGVEERVLILIDPQVVSQVADATTVEFQLCRTSWRMLAAEQAELRKFRDSVTAFSRDRGHGDPFALPDPMAESAPQPTAGFTCTAEQRSVIQAVGLSPAQVEAACGAP